MCTGAPHKVIQAKQVPAEEKKLPERKQQLRASNKKGVQPAERFKADGESIRRYKRW